VHLAEGPAYDVTEKYFGNVIHHLKITWIEDNASRIAMLKHDIQPELKTSHNALLQDNFDT
jgi:hypothetical protein